jgi:ubiquinone/menaquinone biosynthesis C-methylase UbiE
MSLGTRFFAATYDRFMRSTEDGGLRALRGELLAGATGDVLEIGGGTGLNLRHYGTRVQTLTVTEPYPPMLRRLQRRALVEAPAATVLGAPAEELPFDDASFDVVVSTLTLCTVDDQPRSVAELRRVLRPGGRLLFLEHVRSDDPDLARRQDRLNWLNRLVVHCDCNRATLDTLRSQGFEVGDLRHTELPKSPSFVRPLVIGTASPVPTAATRGPEGSARAEQSLSSRR